MTRHFARVAALSAALDCAATPAGAQQPPAAASFLAEARRASERYRDQANAVADGYRAIGPDFPSMGVHWVSIALVAQDTLDPRHPQILEYAQIDGRPSLVGVAWALPLSAGRRVPDQPASPHDWHYHSGSVDEESFVASHGDPAHHPPDGPTVAVLHAWVWLDNPDGPFATDNWALPWARLGLVRPVSASRDASRMVALAGGSDRYFRALFRVVGRPEDSDSAAITEALARGRSAGQAIVTAMKEAGAPRDEDSLMLARAWQALMADVLASVGPATRGRLEALR